MSDERRFDPSSHDSMFARILAEMEADRQQRAEFRAEVRERFDRSGARMDEIHIEVKKTNGRVTRLENLRRNIGAKIAGAVFIFSVLLWFYEHGMLRFGPPETPTATAPGAS